MKLNDLFRLFDNYSEEMVDVYDTTECDGHRTLYEGFADGCPEHLMDREVCRIFATSEYDGLLCIGLHNDLDKED